MIFKARTTVMSAQDLTLHESPADMQIYGFGVWVIELDIGINYIGPDARQPPEVLVGENNSAIKRGLFKSISRKLLSADQGY